jgi:glycerol-3-phosphate O-acyltransferase
VLFHRYERVYVQFEEPVSLKALAQQRLGPRASALSVDAAWEGEASRSSTTLRLQAAGADDAEPAKRRLVQAVANRIAYGIARAVTITPVGLVSAALLSHVRRGITATEVARRVELLRSLAAEGGARLAPGLAGAPADPRQPGPIRDTLLGLVAALLVREQRAADEVIYQVPEEKRTLLDYQRNAVLHRYVAPALVAAAVRAEGPQSGEAVRGRALWLSRLFKLEFIYRPGATVDAVFAENAALLMRLGALARVEEELRPGPDQETLAFLAEFTRAYLEAYRVAVSTALAQARRAPVDRRSLLRDTLERARADFLSGEVILRESRSKATLSNAIEWMIDQQLLVEAEGGRLRLGDPSGFAAEAVVLEIARFLGKG